MKTLSGIKKELEFNRGLASLIDVLKNIAVSQYRALEEKVRLFEDFSLSVESFLDFIDFNLVRHPFLQPASKKGLVIAVTSDTGLLGGLNMQIIQAAVAQLEEGPGELIVIGQRGKVYAREAGVGFVGFPGIIDEQRYVQAMQVRDYTIKRFLSKGYGFLKIVFARPVSFTVQRIEVVPCLPFRPKPAVGQAVDNGPKDIILESPLDDIVEYLLYLWLGQRLYEIFGLSRLAEFAARYVHLEESLQKLKEMDNKLRLTYFRVRHELIDRNMRELFSARILYAH